MMKGAKRAVCPLTMVSKGMILVAIIMLVALYPIVQGGMAKDLTITIVHANNITGHLFPCPM
jgi:hypothetical protein